MNSKAIKRQLLAAIAMVLVAALALGSSTYAWFVASGTVTAEGMKVQAKSEGGLAIRWAGDTSELWGTTASAKMDTAKALYPASTANLAKWTYAKALSASASAADTATYDNITGKVFSGSTGDFTANDYVVMQPFEVRSTAQDKRAEGLFVSDVTVTGSQNKDLDPAIRVGVRLVKTDGTFVGNFIYAPIAGHSTDCTWKDAANGNAETSITLSSVGKSDNANSQLLSKSEVIPFDKGAAVKVQIFIWYEGEDATLFSNNYAVNDLSVSVEFSSYGLNGTPPTGTGA